MDQIHAYRWADPREPPTAVYFSHVDTLEVQCMPLTRRDSGRMPVPRVFDLDLFFFFWMNWGLNSGQPLTLTHS
jgi:hypothetical protein